MGLIRKTLYFATGGVVAPNSKKQWQTGAGGRNDPFKVSITPAMRPPSPDALCVKCHHPWRSHPGARSRCRECDCRMYTFNSRTGVGM